MESKTSKMVPLGDDADRVLEQCGARMTERLAAFRARARSEIARAMVNAVEEVADELEQRGFGRIEPEPEPAPIVPRVHPEHPASHENRLGLSAEPTVALAPAPARAPAKKPKKALTKRARAQLKALALGASPDTVHVHQRRAFEERGLYDGREVTPAGHEFLRVNGEARS